MANSKELIVVAGANGTGKTTFARQYTAEHRVASLGADAVAERLSPTDPASVRLQAGRQFLKMVDAHLRGDVSFLVETTLSGVAFRNTLEQAKHERFLISIFYLYVDSPETCIRRIEQRVRKGGHHVPDTDVRRRFTRSHHNFWNIYREMADNWAIVYNGSEQSRDIVVGSCDRTSIRDSAAFADFRKLLEGKQA